MLTFVVMNVAAAKKNVSEKNQYYGMAIAFTVLAGAYGAGAVSGGCFNPAVALGIDVSSAGVGFGWCVPYILFELLGSAMVAALFKVVRPEDFGGEKSQATELVSEFLGTYMLVLTVGLNVLGSSKAAAFSIAASLTSMIYALGDVSGAHFNPAVTMAIFASGRCPELTPAKAGTYAGVQIAGGIAAALTYAFIYQGRTFGLGPVGTSTWAAVSVAEIVFTFVLAYVVLSVAVSERTKAGGSGMLGYLGHLRALDPYPTFCVPVPCPPSFQAPPPPGLAPLRSGHWLLGVLSFPGCGCMSERPQGPGESDKSTQT